MTKRTLALLLLASLVTTSSRGAVLDDEVVALQQEVALLRAQVAQLAADADGQWLTEQRAAEIRALVQDVLADADTRASLLGSVLTAGWDNGFKIGSADGDFSLQIAGRMQIRYVYNYQSDPDENVLGGDRNRSGFELRRTRLTFAGHILDPSWRYQIQGDFSRSNGAFSLLDAYVDKRFENGWSLRMGQFRPKFMFEDSASSARLLTVEKSLINSQFGQGRSQGVELHVPVGDMVRLSAAFNDGIHTTTGTLGSGANTAWQMRTTEYALLGRGEVLLAGNWSQFREYTSWSSDDFGLMIGAGVAYQRDEYGTPDDVTKMFRWTIDALAKFGGANVFAAFVGNHEDTIGAGSVDQYGFVVQGGFFVIPDQVELFARYEWGDLDTADVSNLSIITAGFNYFIAKHNLKWTTDFGYGLNEVDEEWASCACSTTSRRGATRNPSRISACRATSSAT